MMATAPKKQVDLEDLNFDLDSYRDKTYLTHNYHPYPAKFVPQIPRTLIETLSERGDLIVDPFCGSGTTLVEASLTGRNAVGVDINPIACLVSRAKTTPLSSSQLALARSIGRQATRSVTALYWRQLTEPEPLQEESATFPNIDKWFQPHVKRELAILKGIISRPEDKAVQNFLDAAFSSIIVQVSNQDSETRYVSVEKSVSKGAVGRLFQAKIEDMASRMEQYVKVRQEVTVKVHCMDATEDLPVEEGAASLIVTSPPYLNTFDYYLYHKFRMHWLDFDHKAVQRREFGSRNKHSDEQRGIEHYASKMQASLKQMASIISETGYLVVVVGDAVLRGQLFAMDELVTKLALDCGFKSLRKFSFELRKYSRAFTPGMKTIKKRGHILVMLRG